MGIDFIIDLFKKNCRRQRFFRHICFSTNIDKKNFEKTQHQHEKVKKPFIQYFLMVPQPLWKFTCSSPGMSSSLAPAPSSLLTW